MNFFEEQIQQLGVLLQVPLHAEKGKLCKLRIHGSFSISIELDSVKDRILFASFLSELPSGKFREEVLKQALKSNGTIDSFGIFAYSEKNNSLVFFSYVASSFGARELAEVLTHFISRAEQWKHAIDSGNLNTLISI